MNMVKYHSSDGHYIPYESMPYYEWICQFCFVNDFDVAWYLRRIREPQQKKQVKSSTRDEVSRVSKDLPEPDKLPLL